MPEYDPDHPLKHQSVSPLRRKRVDPPIEPSPEDEKIDWGLVDADPGFIILEDFNEMDLEE